MPLKPPPPSTGAKKKPPVTVGGSYALETVLKGKGKAYLPYKSAIIAAASYYNLDPVVLLALLVRENDAANPKARNASGATGLAQVLDATVNKSLNSQQWVMYKARLRELGIKGDPAKTHATDAKWSINYAAWRMKGHMAATGNDVDAAYQKYNPGYSDTPILQNAGVPKQYTPSATYGKTPTLGAAASVATEQATTAAKLDASLQIDPYVIVDKNGHMKTTTDPTKALKGIGSQGLYPVRLSDWQVIKNGAGDSPGLDELYQLYTGHNASARETAAFVRNSWSTQHMQNQLMLHDPRFYKSPRFKSAWLGYNEMFLQVYGPGFKLDPKIVRDAIYNGWGQTDFEGKIRSLPQYTKSGEFKRSSDEFIQAFQKIYGKPDKEDNKLIQDAVLARWSPDQFSSYLRARPEYLKSPEYHANETAKYMASIQLTGRAPIIETAKESPYVSATQTPPADKRVKGGPPTGKPEGETYTTPLQVTSAGKPTPAKTAAKPAAPKKKEPWQTALAARSAALNKLHGIK